MEGKFFSNMTNIHFFNCACAIRIYVGVGPIFCVKIACSFSSQCYLKTYNHLFFITYFYLTRLKFSCEYFMIIFSSFLCIWLIIILVIPKKYLGRIKISIEICCALKDLKSNGIDQLHNWIAQKSIWFWRKFQHFNWADTINS